MPAQRPHPRAPAPSKEASEVKRLLALGPEAQGEVDESLLRDNLNLSPVERLKAASEAATQLDRLRRAVGAACHG